MQKATKELKEKMSVKMEGAKKNKEDIKINELRRLHEITQRGLSKTSNVEQLRVRHIDSD